MTTPSIYAKEGYIGRGYKRGRGDFGGQGLNKWGKNYPGSGKVQMVFFHIGIKIGLYIARDFIHFQL